MDRGNCVECGHRMIVASDYSYWCIGCNYSCIIYDEGYCKWGVVLESGYP